MAELDPNERVCLDAYALREPTVTWRKQEKLAACVSYLVLFPPQKIEIQSRTSSSSSSITIEWPRRSLVQKRLNLLYCDRLQYRRG